MTEQCCSWLQVNSFRIGYDRPNRNCTVCPSCDERFRVGEDGARQLILMNMFEQTQELETIRKYPNTSGNEGIPCLSLMKRIARHGLRSPRPYTYQSWVQCQS